MRPIMSAPTPRAGSSGRAVSTGQLARHDGRGLARVGAGHRADGRWRRRRASARAGPAGSGSGPAVGTGCGGARVAPGATPASPAAASAAASGSSAAHGVPATRRAAGVMLRCLPPAPPATARRPAQARARHVAGPRSRETCAPATAGDARASSARAASAASVGGGDRGAAEHAVAARRTRPPGPAPRRGGARPARRARRRRPGATRPGARPPCARTCTTASNGAGRRRPRSTPGRSASIARTSSAVAGPTRTVPLTGSMPST